MKNHDHSCSLGIWYIKNDYSENKKDLMQIHKETLKELIFLFCFLNFITIGFQKIIYYKN